MEDEEYAVSAYSLQKENCSVVPYGIVLTNKIKDAAERVKKRYNISSRFLFYFNGTLDYEPNRKAVEDILNNLLPQLKKTNLDFTLLISGKRLSSAMQDGIMQTTNIRYLDFVEDVELLYQAADVFINPVINDSGVKTKIVEALAHDCTVISTASGATGIPAALAGKKLVKAPDGDWKKFVSLLAESLEQPSTETPPSFFLYFAWQNIAERAASFIQATIKYAWSEL